MPWFLLEQMDESRRGLGKILDSLGWGPIETPSRVVLSEPAVTLKAYGDGGAGGPIVLLVPAPIKRAYIWDLVPYASVVQQCLRQGAQVYLIQWETPGADERGFGLAEYADRLILDCIRTIEAESGPRRAFLAGHSIGGTLAAIFAALHPERVRGLVLLGAPLHFGPDAGALGVAAAVAPPTSLLATVPGNVPGSFLDTVAFLAAPGTFEWARWIDWLDSLPRPRAWQMHLRVERWTLDELPWPPRLFEEVMELLYREDRFMRGTLMVRGQRVGPTLVEAPLLSVVFRPCSIAPPQSVTPFHRAARSAETRLLWYPGDTGVALQHVGMLVGEAAHRELWPEILRWVHAQDKWRPAPRAPRFAATHAARGNIRRAHLG